MERISEQDFREGRTTLGLPGRARDSVFGGEKRPLSRVPAGGQDKKAILGGLF